MACFTHLRDNLPNWICDVNQLSVHVHNKRAEFAAEAAKQAPTPLRRRKSMSSSVSTVATADSFLEPPTATAAAGHRLKRFLSRDSLRFDTLKKRRDASPQPPRTSDTQQEPEDSESIITPCGRHMKRPVVYYDGHTQKTLEKMVRDIWTAKSNIRSSRIQSSMRTALAGKMRMQIPVQRYSTEHSSKSSADKGDGQGPIEVDDNLEQDTSDLSDPMELRMFMMKQRHRRFQPPQPLASSMAPLQHKQQQQQQQQQEIERRPSRPTRPKQCPYDFVEGQLDNAQNLCESAAYRFLRYGNCLEELEEILRAYEFILEASSTMAEKEDEEREAEAEAETDQGLIEIDDGAIDVDEDDIAVETIAVATSKHSSLDASNGGILEVDDRSDTSEVSIDITAFRMTRYGQRTMHPFTVSRVR